MTGNIIGIEFEDEYRAREALIAASRLQRDRALWLEDAALVERDTRGRVQLLQTRQPSPTTVALWAGVWAWMFGLLIVGPRFAIPVALIAALAGALWAGRDTGIPDELMRRAGKGLTPGSTAAFLMVGHAKLKKALTELGRFNGRVIYSDLPERLESRVSAGLASPS